MSDFRQPLIVLDVETTGLDERDTIIDPESKAPARGDQLLQVAAVALDGLDELIVPDSRPVAFNGYLRVDSERFHSLYNQCNDYVRDMHMKSNVWASVSGNSVMGEVDDRFSTFHEDAESIDSGLYDWIENVFGETKPDLLGASITLDRNFLRKFTPKSFELINYRNLDVSSVRNFLIGANKETFQFNTKQAEHNGLDDALFTAVHAAKIADQMFGGERAEALLKQFNENGLPYESIDEAFENVTLG